MKYARRIYPMGFNAKLKKKLGLKSNEILSEEEIAVVFARTSRSQKKFDEMAKEITEEGAANFHQKWVVSVEGFGHASVAEHAIHHMAVEHISSLAVDEITDNRLASYTEQSGRYQILPIDYFYTPHDLEKNKRDLTTYTNAQKYLFSLYNQFVDEGMKYIYSEESLKKDPSRKKKDGEEDKTYAARLRKIVTDNARFLNTAGRLSNVGVTANARAMEYMLIKLLSSPYPEVVEVGEIMKKQAVSVTPTLVKYAESSSYLQAARKSQEILGKKFRKPLKIRGIASEVDLLYFDKDADNRFIAAILYRDGKSDYETIFKQVERMSKKQKEKIVKAMLSKLGSHDIPIRELEFATDYLFEFRFDYGTYREYKRHRIQTYIAKPPSVYYGYIIPDLFIEMSWERRFREAMKVAENAYKKLEKKYPYSVHYLITRAHIRPTIAKLNLREGYHLFKLRTRSGAHYLIRRPILQAFKKAEKVHPLLWKYYLGPKSVE
jgi:thymidylate synthase ThyX